MASQLLFLVNICIHEEPRWTEWQWCAVQIERHHPQKRLMWCSHNAITSISTKGAPEIAN